MESSFLTNGEEVNAVVMSILRRAHKNVEDHSEFLIAHGVDGYGVLFKLQLKLWTRRAASSSPSVVRKFDCRRKGQRVGASD